MSFGLLERIRACLPALSPSEQKVALLALDDPRAFINLPVASLAQRSAVSKPTVIRFCRSMGHNGLADFKLKLAGNVNEGVPFVHRAVEADDPCSDIVVKVIDNAVAALLQYRNHATSAAFDRTIERLVYTAHHRGCIAFFGVGNSGIVATDAQLKFLRLGIHTTAPQDSHIQIMSATLLGREDCAVLISNAGRSSDLLDVADIARKRGVTTVAITASDSPLAHATLSAHHILLAADHPEHADRYSPMVSRLLHLMIIDILSTGVALQITPPPQPLLQAIKSNLKTHRSRKP